MAKKIMVLGTGSSVGKSVIVAGLCRAFANRQMSVFPFKSQNMSNNSFITKEGDEMGRAQVSQALAARKRPIAAMNPILLKPTSDVGSQVIVMGKVYKNLSAKDYFKEKLKLLPIAIDAFNSLKQDSDLMIIEGAGSPAEINLRQVDIVNMGFAEAVDSSCILVGDIDKGGVFASIYGTYFLLAEEERKRIKGFVINKFRGDVTLLSPGIKEVEELIGIPCLGVIPYVKHLNIDDEDSANDSFINTDDIVDEGPRIEIVVVNHPHASNLTDLTALRVENGVNLRIANRPEELENSDLILLPGSKNTIADMEAMRDSGIADKIVQMAENGTYILGICGGFQMLGERIVDEYSVESSRGSIEGLGLLPVETRMQRSKRTVATTGCVIGEFISSEVLGTQVEGYEIHMGKTILLGDADLQAFVENEAGQMDGFVKNGQIAGTYFHGFFDRDEIRSAIINGIREKRQMKRVEIKKFKDCSDAEYDRLARILEESMDLDALIDIAK